MRARLALSASLVALISACSDVPPPVPATPQPPAIPAPTTTTAPIAAPEPTGTDRVKRLDFNRIAAELNLPLFWIADDAGPGTLDPKELAVLWGITPGASKSTYVNAQGELTQAFRDAYERIVKVAKDGLPAQVNAGDAKRQKLVKDEIDAGRPSLLGSDFTKASAEDKALIEHVVKAADVIERLYAKQLGVYGLDKDIPPEDTASKTLFYRNHGPYCVTPKNEKDPSCKALAREVPRVSGLYPASVQKEPKFCEALEARKDQKELLGPFTAVIDAGGGKLKAVPFTEIWKEDTLEVSRELKAAAAAITSPGEAALKAYLEADAQAFVDNNWFKADEAWSKMTRENSKWYLRIAPDETYGDTCSHKGGFQVSFAKINQDSVAWQKRLEPVKNDMEQAIAELAGAPYKSRKGKVKFHLPDFIDIVLNAGDARSPIGATVGESLPNWGPVAKESRGRTVAMTNIGIDKDSNNAMKERLESLYCKDTLDRVDYDPSLNTMGTVLHEAAHNLGPAQEYKVRGKGDEEIFGGALAAMLEELKAQTSSLYFADWLLGKNLLDKKTVENAHVRDIVWAFGHIAEGMYTADNKPKPYAQLAAIQVGWLLKDGAIVWNKDEAAPNGSDKGCFSIKLEKFASSVASLEKQVAGIKGRGDKEGAQKLREEFVDRQDAFDPLRKLILERWSRQTAASFVYAIDR